MKKKKGMEVADSLKCHGSAISKTGIKLARNRKRGSSVAKFKEQEVGFFCGEILSTHCPV